MIAATDCHRDNPRLTSPWSATIDFPGCSPCPFGEGGEGVGPRESEPPWRCSACDLSPSPAFLQGKGEQMQKIDTLWSGEGIAVPVGSTWRAASESVFRSSPLAGGPSTKNPEQRAERPLHNPVSRHGTLFPPPDQG